MSMPDVCTLDRLTYDLEAYERLLQSLLDDGFTFTDFSTLEADEIVLRHDVDLSPTTALEMARIEASLGVESTYCFLLTTPIYNLLEVEHVQALQEIEALGHDVALHFNTHHYWDGPPEVDELTTKVRAECDVIGQLTDSTVDTVSFHRPPEWVLDVDFDGFENTYQPQYFSEIGYLSDSNQKWQTEPPFPNGRPDRLQLLVHPGLWGPTERELDDIITELATDCYEHVDRYLEALGV
ncbi:hypothetical protein OB955_00990 [Halobacteria archaeon AArc-m2/3/4]|uniref:Uncharacterized protein n=1 Tax=Natronoglomus mannanivorans TaxID=2979990 RepID=A0AAP2Z0E9_9EURY|nr:hypothetical protein [Halobacteria archaeon AArc-xg1-1]MCU4971315.1 hypothetical protein [Halobacteria archaeon AArc-m2/3/4]